MTSSFSTLILRHRTKPSEKKHSSEDNSKLVIEEVYTFYKSKLVKETTILRKSKLRSWGYEPIFCSVKTKTGLDSFLLNLRDQTTVIVEPGGVGKSSLINVFLKTVISFSLSCSILSFHMSQIPRNNWLELVSARSGRQKHTTPNVSLLPLRGGGYLADTPGLNRFSLSNVTKESLALCFPETAILRKSKLRSWGYEPIFCSVKTKTGLDSFLLNLRDQTTVIVEPGGVGKSSTPIPRNNWLELVSARSGRQKHTTPNVSLLPLRGGGYLADTPRLNRFSLSNVTKESLALCFPEVCSVKLALLSFTY
ncbi:EngC GTPase [Artemisia annua]|uniref:EngC GTPase n=1 Tax=Artemisia annua TaxID=35608 RepID=A0A2U1PB99_ARTAN|nr:EngC GTPase [Artemisia annua]